MKTKIMLILWLCLALWSHLYCQQTTLFQVVIQFEDAVGNKDSVTVGYDPDATFGIDAEFGEAEITVPFDSVFEVRGMSRFDFDQKFSKVIIDESDFIFGLNCYGEPIVYLFVWSKYQPVTVKWDSSLFLNDVCVRSSFISNHQEDEVAGPFDLDEFPPICACMAAQSLQYFELSEEALPPENSTITFNAEVEGMGNQVIYGLRFKPSDPGGYTPCYWITTDTEEPFAAAPLSISPNPSHGLVKITSGEHATFEQLKIFDATGHLVRSISGIKNSETDLSGLPNGIYQLQAQDRDGKRYVGRVVKL